MSEAVVADAEALRAEVRDKYREVATNPGRTFHFHTGRALAERLGYDGAVVAAMPERAVESFADVATPFAMRVLRPGERVVDIAVGPPVDTFAGASGEANARRFDVRRYPFIAHKPASIGPPEPGNGAQR